MITASPVGEEEAGPSGRGAEGVAVPPWKRREARGEWESGDATAEPNTALSLKQRRERCKARC